MKFRTSHLVGLMAIVLAVSSTTYFIDPAVAADTPKVKPLKVMGPDGQIRQVNQQYGPTTSKDTFWSIAQKVRPDASVSVYQVMAALFDANPHAFNSDNYNSLERGMILLIPSKEVMLAIPNRVAIARAERDDKLARTGVKSPVKTTTPKTTEPKTVTKVITQAPPEVAPVTVAAPVAVVEPKAEPKPEPVDPKQAEAVSQTATVVKSEPKMLSSDVNARLEAAERKILSLTDELARTQDQLSVRNSDVEALKVKVEELNQQIALLEETLLVSKQQNQVLKAEVEAAQSPDVVSVPEPETPTEPGELWRNIVNNPAMLIAAAVIPALLILLLVFLMLRRKRNKERRELEAQQAAMVAGGAGMATGATILSMDEDDLNDMAIHLDTDHTDSIESLLDVGSVSLQPEQGMADSDEQTNIASEIFIDSGSVQAEPQFEEDEGQSLDDLWAEAMGDQEEALAEEKPQSGNILEEEDLDALLAGFGTEDSSNATPDDADTLANNVAEDLTDTDDFTDIETSEVNDTDTDLGAEIAAALEAELDDLGVDNNDDIDALLADFDKLTPSEQAADLGEEIAAELDSDLESLGVEDIDDIDVLLADFDKPAAPEPDLGDEIAAELDAELNDIAVDNTDDIDTLLAGFDEPASTAPSLDDAVAQEIAAELEAELDTSLSDTDEDLEQLLAEFDMQDKDDIVPHDATSSDVDTSQIDTSDADDTVTRDEIATELEASLPEDFAGSEDDLDALLAEFDVPEQGEADSDDFNFDIETTPLDTQDSANDEDNLLKGIGATHALDGTDDTFTLVEDLSDDIDTTAEDAKFTGFNSDDVNSDALTTAALAATVAAAASAKEKESSFFNDLKANKGKDPHVLDWDTELDFASKPAEPNVDIAPTIDEPTDASLDAPVISKPSSLDLPPETKKLEPKVDFELADDLDNDLPLSKDFDLGDDLDLSTDLDLSDDSVLAAFTANTDFDDDDILTTEDSFALDDEHTLTVDEALAALDAQESRQSKKFVPEHDLTNFQNENGFIDIDKLLNDAEQDRSDTDLYPEVDIEMSDVGALIGDAAMIDVDDEENSVSAKLDLARAYIEIDDSDSAKALLKEVQIDGNERQQDEAARLLKEIG
ncbi:pilus assembly protein FimV [Shewanella profunda]|uniref:FimV/HubP family polar landmark protein n=1 Tax=Shewanella profunda TaxID=254793 RepID=UPI00200CDBE2|nr:FimV/HubP family polar landmark protein [Shewanella profunda]MCL1091695.1 pilus assembly protein FimV [Shewanella profunda]